MNWFILLRESTELVSVCKSLPSPVNVTVNRISGHNHMTVVHTLYQGAQAHNVVLVHCGFQGKPYQVLISVLRSIIGAARILESLIWLPLSAYIHVHVYCTHVDPP